MIDATSNSIVTKNLDQLEPFANWIIWYPDLFLDLLKPQAGGINLNSDQRVFLRCATRFFSLYGCFTRGWGKTWGEVAASMIIAIRYPNIRISLTAQTKENSAKLLKEKYNDLIKQYPMFENEVLKYSFSPNYAIIELKNGSILDSLANSQSSKGLRRHRINIEESVLMNNEIFDDVLKPIVEDPRHTCGNLAIANPEELNQQINFFTTPGWKGSDEYIRSLKMIRNMIDLKGEMVLGSDWKLGCWYGRGSPKSEILKKKSAMSPTAFDQNYGGIWTGSSTGALVNINKLIECRTLTSPETSSSSNSDEYYIGVDVARSQNSNNNQSSIVIGKAKRSQRNNRLASVSIVNIINIPNILNFSAQACMVKKVKKSYNAKMVIVDGNGLGAGLIDELLKESYDPITKEYLGCFNTINTSNEPEVSDAEACLFDLKAQSAQSKIVSVFIDMVDSGKLRLLQKRQDYDFTDKENNDFDLKIMPYIQTDLLFEEVSNLKIKHLQNGGLTVEQVVRKINKDRFSALAYLLYYINEYADISSSVKPFSVQEYVQALSKISYRPKTY